MPAAAAAVGSLEHGSADGEGWRATLELGFARRRERTVLVRRRHSGPLLVQSAFYPEGDPCHVYLLHPPGGLVGGDRLHVEASLAEHSHALLTTPAAGKFYRSRCSEGGAPISRVDQHIAVGADATLEWLPCESIVFDGARVDARTHFQLAASARVIAWDGWVFGRPACGERFASGTFTQHLEIRVDGRPVLIERNDLCAGSPWMQQAWGLGARVAMATLVGYPGGELALQAARAACVPCAGSIAACTELDGLLVCRVLARRLPALRAQMERWWQALRPLVIGREPVAPRIWAT